MAKETQKAKIERLEKEIKQLNDEKDILIGQNNKLYTDLMEKNDNADEIFKNSPHFQQLNNELDLVKEKLRISDNRCKRIKTREQAKDRLIEKLQNEIQHIHKLKNENITPRKNERNAGRKNRFTDDQVKQIIADRDGMTIKELADKYNCSVGLIHKLINEK